MTDAYLEPETGELITPELFIARSSWRLAQSRDHEYTVRGRTAPGDGSFAWFVQLARDKGERRTFAGRVYAYLPVGQYEYWTMNWPVAQTTIVNRQRIEDRPIKPAQKSQHGVGQVPGDQLPLLPDDQDEDR